MLEQSNFGNKIAVAFIERKKRSLISLGLGFVQRGLPTYCRLKKKKEKCIGQNLFIDYPKALEMILD